MTLAVASLWVRFPGKARTDRNALYFKYLNALNALPTQFLLNLNINHKILLMTQRHNTPFFLLNAPIRHVHIDLSLMFLCLYCLWSRLKVGCHNGTSWLLLSHGGGKGWWCLCVCAYVYMYTSGASDWKVTERLRVYLPASCSLALWVTLSRCSVTTTAYQQLSTFTYTPVAFNWKSRQFF